MGRRKGDALILNLKARRQTRLNRTKGLLRKASQLSTLCGIEVHIRIRGDGASDVIEARFPKVSNIDDNIRGDPSPEVRKPTFRSTMLANLQPATCLFLLTRGQPAGQRTQSFQNGHPVPSLEKYFWCNITRWTSRIDSVRNTHPKP